MGSQLFFVCILILSLFSGIFSVGLAVSATGHITHFGQFFAGILFLINGGLALAGLGCRIEED